MNRHALITIVLLSLVVPTYAADATKIEDVKLDLDALKKWGTRNYSVWYRHKSGSSVQYKPQEQSLMLKAEVTKDSVVCEMVSLRPWSETAKQKRRTTMVSHRNNRLTMKSVTILTDRGGKEQTRKMVFKNGKVTETDGGVSGTTTFPTEAACDFGVRYLVTLLPRTAGAKYDFGAPIQIQWFTLDKTLGPLVCVGPETIEVAGKKVECTLYHWPSKVPADGRQSTVQHFWVDEHGVLVRFTLNDQGVRYDLTDEK